MPNDYFSFKQFTINQAQCAMKVCTDSCLFGAWMANLSAQNILPFNTTLDIGAGTGLLSIMLAQKSSGNINAVELEPFAAAQAVQNCLSSPWNDRLSVYQQSIQQFDSLHYELIFCNPPFYAKQLNSPSPERNIALHSAALTLEELCHHADRLLTSKGKFCVLIPFDRTPYFIGIARQQGLYLLRQTLVRQTEHHLPFRSMLLFGRSAEEPLIYEEITIKKNASYTAEFTFLLRDYYLNL